jgi:CRP-like cAMP-binding protein
MAGTSSERAALLSKMELFQGLTVDQLEELVAATSTRRLAAREELFHKGDPGSSVYLIASGRLKAMTTSSDGDDVVFSIMGPGENFGELAVLQEGRRTATIVAIDASELVVLDRRELLPFLRRHPEASVALLAVIARRLERVSELLEDTHFLNLPARLAKRLLTLAENYGEKTGEGIKIKLRLSQTELGDLVATTRESINKQMRIWTEEGVASMDAGYVTIRDEDRLQDVADEGLY